MYALPLKDAAAAAVYCKILGISAEEKYSFGELWFFSPVKLPEKLHVIKLELGHFLNS